MASTISPTENSLQSQSETTVASKESLYRTMWLMAHNALHKAVHDKSEPSPDLWNDYLKELQSAEFVAQKPA